MARIFTDADFADSQQASSTTPASQGRIFSDADFAEADVLPSYANGLSPETAINQSPIDLTDRAALSVGNEAGKMKFLKEKFGAVQKTKSGELVVNNKGFWQRVDPEGLGDGDAWSMTKELIADVTGITPAAVNVAAQVGAGAAAAAATGGASLTAQAGISAAVGAALKVGETSLGRLVGTYEASPEEQLKDIGLEAMLNLGGTYVAAGVKPTLSMVADGLGKFAKVTGLAKGKDMFIEGWGTLTGVGAKNMDRLISNPDAVTAAMKEGALKGGDDVVGYLVNENVKDVGRIARASRVALTDLYDNLADDVINNVDNSFSSDLKGAIQSAYAKLAEMGAGTIDDAGKFSLYTKDQLANKLSTSGEINALLTDEKSYAIVTDMVDKLSPYAEASALKGKAGAKQLMQFRKTIADATFRLKEEADEAFLIPAQRIVAGVNEAIDNNVIRSFQLPSPVRSKVTGEMADNLLLHTNQIYKNTTNEISPLLRAAASAQKQGSDMSFQTLYNQLNSVQGRNTVQKSAFDKAVDLLGSYGGSAGKASKDMFNSIRNREAAAAFTPNFKRGLVSQGGIGMAVGGAVAMNPTVALMAAGTAAATSPKLQKNLISGAMQLKSTLANLSSAQKMQFLNDPKAIQTAVRTIIELPQTREMMTNQLMQQGVRAAQGGQ